MPVGRGLLGLFPGILCTRVRTGMPVGRGLLGLFPGILCTRVNVDPPWTRTTIYVCFVPHRLVPGCNLIHC